MATACLDAEHRVEPPNVHAQRQSTVEILKTGRPTGSYRYRSSASWLPVGQVEAVMLLATFLWHWRRLIANQSGVDAASVRLANGGLANGHLFVSWQRGRAGAISKADR
jgi:hypothetical protein